jgi:osmotically inducible lipoprotein OsmB
MPVLQVPTASGGTFLQPASSAEFKLFFGATLSLRGKAAAARQRKKSPNIWHKGKNMNSKILMSVAASVVTVAAFAGCSTSPTNAQIGTATGAVLGGVAGNAVFGGALGTVGGAAAGAVIGNEVGKKR